MSRFLAIIFVVFSFCACSERNDGQWSLNKSIGWKPDRHDDYVILFLKLNNPTSDSIQLSDKKSLDEAVLKMLHQKGVGGQVENDESMETDLHFFFPVEYEESSKVIFSVVEERGYQGRVTLWRREHDSSGRWSDQMIIHE